MWSRRVLIATMIAAAAVVLTRHGAHAPIVPGVAYGSSDAIAAFMR